MLRFARRAVSWRVLFQMATVGASTGLVKIAGAAKVVFMARAFGMSDGLDAYLIAFLLPAFVCDTLAGSLNSALVPTFIEVREMEGRAAADRLYRSVLAAGAGLAGGWPGSRWRRIRAVDLPAARIEFRCGKARADVFAVLGDAADRAAGAIGTLRGERCSIPKVDFALPAMLPR